jgi:hypothetical protein
MEEKMHFIVIENDSGLLVAQVNDTESNENAAVRQAGVIVDPGPYQSFDDAYDAMQLIPGIDLDAERLT